MTKQRSIITLIILDSISIILSCSNNKSNSKAALTIDTQKIRTTPTTKNGVVGISQDSLISFTKLSKTIFRNKKANRPFDELVFNKVIAYDYEGGKDEQVIDIITDGNLAPTIKQQKELTQKQVDDLTNYLGSGSTYGGSKAFCFNPHLGIVFYMDNAIIAHISICLECNYLSSSIKIPATEVKKIKIDDDFEYPAEGFSKLGRQKINLLCKQLNFSHCADTLNSMFDE